MNAILTGSAIVGCILFTNELSLRDCAGDTRPLGDTGPLATAHRTRRPVLTLTGSGTCRLVLPTSDGLLALEVAGERSACELWCPAAGSSELSLGEGWYHGLDRFGRISRNVHFPAGSGLPGRAWSTGAPILGADLQHSPRFLRSSGATSEGLSQGLALPLIQGTSLVAVAVILAGGPVAPLIELWRGPQAGSVEVIARLGEPGIDHGPAVQTAIAAAAPRITSSACAIPVTHSDGVRAVLVLAW